MKRLWVAVLVALAGSALAEEAPMKLTGTAVKVASWPFIGATTDETVHLPKSVVDVEVNGVPLLHLPVADMQQLPVVNGAPGAGDIIDTATMCHQTILRHGDNHFTIIVRPAHDIVYSLSIVGTSDHGRQTRVLQNLRGETRYTVMVNLPNAPDRPWHHYPAVGALSKADRGAITKLVGDQINALAAGSKPAFQALDCPNFSEQVTRKTILTSVQRGLQIRPGDRSRWEFLPAGGAIMVRGGLSGPGGRPSLVDYERLYRSIGHAIDYEFLDDFITCAFSEYLVVRTPAGVWELAPKT